MPSQVPRRRLRAASGGPCRQNGRFPHHRAAGRGSGVRSSWRSRCAAVRGVPPACILPKRRRPGALWCKSVCSYCSDFLVSHVVCSSLRHDIEKMLRPDVATQIDRAEPRHLVLFLLDALFVVESLQVGALACTELGD